MKTKALRFWAANFVGALFVLWLLKAGLVWNNMFGTEGFEPPLKLFLKAFLFVGWDVVGAALLALVATLLATPLLAMNRNRTALGLSALLQAIHAAFSTISVFTSVYVGSLINKAAIDLAWLNQLGDDGGKGAGALNSSIGHHLHPVNLSIMVLLPLIAIALTIVVWQYWEEIPRRAKQVSAAATSIFALLSVALLPFLINGEIAGIRVHTHSLEKSPFYELAWSYVEPPLSRLLRPRTHLADEFYMDLSSIADPETRLDNPLLKARPRQNANILLISLESVGQVYVRDDETVMPFLTSIGRTRQGVSFRNHFSNWPQTMKVFFTIFCSELPYPYYNPITFINPAIPCKSMTEVLHDAGYYNMLITTADLAYDRKMRFFRHREFDLVYDMRSLPGRETVWSNSWGLDERLAVKVILEEASRHTDKPWFVFYEMATAHHPYHACAEHEEDPLEDEFESYKRALRFIDDRVRDLVLGLEQKGLADNTLVVIYSDHAEGFGQHSGSKSHGPKVYSENLQVPFAVTGPQTAGITSRVLFTTSHLDVAPTALGLVGLPPPCTMKGRDLTSVDTPAIAIMGGRPPGAQSGVADGRFKYIIEDNGLEMLFDIYNDPAETANIIADHKQLPPLYRAKLDEWRAFSENLIEHYAQLLGESTCR